jgi:hypothetical protein
MNPKKPLPKAAADRARAGGRKADLKGLADRAALLRKGPRPAIRLDAAHEDRRKRRGPAE